MKTCGARNMTELLTAAQMRAIEAAAIESGAVTGLELMERAGRGVVDAVFEAWPELCQTKGGGAAPTPPRYLDQDERGALRALVLCGPGNNGGDGFVVARLLKDAGCEVQVCFFGTPESLPADARLNYERWLAQHPVLPIVPLQAKNWADVEPLICGKTYQLVIDAVFGIGLTRHIDEPLKTLLNALNDSMGCGVSRVVAIDTPSGLCSDSGKAMAQWPLRADLTVTFQLAKLGHFLGQGPFYSGRLRVVDIGLQPPETEQNDGIALIEQPHPMTAQRARGHKFAYGHALILSGGIASGGAARLAARGALRVGAGVVTLGCPPAAMMANAAQLNAVMLRPVRDAAALEAVLADRRINALCLGPGMGIGGREAEVLRIALQRRGESIPTVLDADALTMLASDAELFGLLHGGCILTPHAGEFARLFPDIAARLVEPTAQGPAYSKVDATRDAAKRAGCVVLFKGPDTVIAAPDGRCSINAALYERAAPWLATAGSGDVLAGFVTGLLAQGVAPMEAAETGAWLHVECARSFGPGLIAEDLPEELPKVFRSLESKRKPAG
jgi:ADP-dependent NAD(P)H-hydrate dehydratase / NAD(P)H-hydrate epimerase